MPLPNPQMIVGVAWFREDQWQWLRALAADPEVLEPTHAEWLAIAEKTMRDLAKHGVVAQKVTVDVYALHAWCVEQRRPLNSSARAEYVSAHPPGDGNHA
ncbi:hypothetical protein LBMAG56_26820 [Verrucomicrobiota bacterium]|nr:hypothetical protein LBMAG56_26820 [Verrucomicrobiota bacterium]